MHPLSFFRALLHLYLFHKLCISSPLLFCKLGSDLSLSSDLSWYFICANSVSLTTTSPVAIMFPSYAWEVQCILQIIFACPLGLERGKDSINVLAECNRMLMQFCCGIHEKKERWILVQQLMVPFHILRLETISELHLQAPQPPCQVSSQRFLEHFQWLANLSLPEAVHSISDNSKCESLSLSPDNILILTLRFIIRPAKVTLT